LLTAVLLPVRLSGYHNCQGPSGAGRWGARGGAKPQCRLPLICKQDQRAGIADLLPLILNLYPLTFNLRPPGTLSPPPGQALTGWILPLRVGFGSGFTFRSGFGSGSGRVLPFLLSMGNAIIMTIYVKTY
jgi:hypothetical protein